MSGTFTLTVSEARGTVAIPANLDNTAVVIGCSSLGTEGALSSFYQSGSAAVSALGYGDAVDTVAQMIEQRGADVAKVPVALYTTPVDTDGEQGTIAKTMTGTAVPVAGAALPLGTYEAKILITTGGTVGTSGVVYQWSLDGGRTLSRKTALGTSTSITIPNSGVEFYLDPPSAQVTALVALVNDIRTDVLAHFILTAGSVHGAADTTSDDGIGSAATDGPTAIVLVNTLRTGILAHFARGSTVHTTADTTSGTAIPAAAVTLADAAKLADALKAAYNLHRVHLSYHGAADGTNVVTASDVSQGTLVAGDYWTVRTTAPKPGATEIDDASDALVATASEFSIIVCDFDCDASLAAHVSTMLDALAAIGRDCTAIIRTRSRDFEAGETEAAWQAAVAADFANFEDDRIVVRASYQFVTDAMTSRSYLRHDLAQFAADVVRVRRAVWPCAPADRAMPNASLVDGNGTRYGHDEGPQGSDSGLSDDGQGNRFSCVQRLPVSLVRQNVYNTVPWVAYPEDSTIRNLPTCRLVNAMRRVARVAAIPTLGARLYYTSTGAGTGTLTAASRTALHGSIYQAIANEFAAEIDNAADAALDTGLVQVSPPVTVSGGNLLGVSVTLAPKIGGYVRSVTITIAVQE